MTDPANPTDAAAAEATPPEKPILAPGKLGPWEWWAGRDEESYAIGPHGTREDAIEEAAGTHDEGFLLIEARQLNVDLSRYMTLGAVERWIEHLEEGVFCEDGFTNEAGDPLTDRVTAAQWADLAARLSQTVRDWQTAHGIQIMKYSFAEIRNEAFVEIGQDGTVTIVPLMPTPATEAPTHGR
jgi:hypothetical protein